MDCSEVREHLGDLNRGRLEAGMAEALRAHVAGCAICAEALRIDAEIRALIRAQVPKHTAPPELRARIQALLAAPAPTQVAPTRSARWRAWLFGRRWTVGSLAGAMAVVLLVWAGSLWMIEDPVSRMASSAVGEHVEYVKETMNRPAADPPAVVRDLKGQVDYSFEPIFPGDSRVQLVAGKVSDLSGKRAAAFVYRDEAGRYTTLFLMPEAGIVIPAEGRMPIETFKPYHRVVSGRQLLLWKQGKLACLLVSDLDQAGSSAMFLKIRKAL
jgi:anti-sigma factor (TIGR02949 family)